MPTVLRVALPVPLPNLFDYLPAAGQAAVGSRVLVPFGRGKQVGVVVEVATDTAIDTERLKPVIRLLDEIPLLDSELMQTLAWATDYWLGAPGEVYATALPLALREARARPVTPSSRKG
jgi:primosomal protein N' (replication factor Y)